jgi:hypothetical protein
VRRGIPSRRTVCETLRLHGSKIRWIAPGAPGRGGGDDRRKSVLDRDNPAHDLDNLYVLEASFFSSSGGINPNLTIVANSLRATDKIAQRL